VSVFAHNFFLSAMLLVLTVTNLIVKEWGGLRWHNTNTRLYQNSSSDCPEDSRGQQVDKHDHNEGVTAPSEPRPLHYGVFTSHSDITQ
jgi:hypothetical protein